MCVYIKSMNKYIIIVIKHLQFHRTAHSPQFYENRFKINGIKGRAMSFTTIIYNDNLCIFINKT